MALKMIAFDTMPNGTVTVETLLDETSGACWAIGGFLADGVYIPMYPTAQSVEPVVTDRGVPVFGDAVGARAFLEAWNAGERDWAANIPGDIPNISVVNGRIVRGE